MTSVALGAPPERRPVKTPIAVYRLVAVAWLGVVLIIYPTSVRELQGASVLALVATAVALLLLRQALPQRQWSVAFLYLVVLAVFHAGALFFPALGLPAPLPNARDALWFYSAETATAAGLVAIGISAYAVGALLAGPARTSSHDGDGRRWEAVATAGTVLLFGGVLGWFFMSVLFGGLAVLTGSYEAFLSATTGSPLSAMYIAISIGLTLAATTRVNAKLRLAFAVFGIFAVVAFVLGLRGEVLFPVAAVLMVRANVQRMPSGIALVAIILVCLTAVSVVKQVRQTGVSELSVSSIVLSPAAGIAELGYSIRVVATSVAWHESGSEPYKDGVTYAAPLERPVSRYVLGRDVPDAWSDQRLMNVEIAEREGNIGGSIIGEAHHNFGYLGVLIVPGIVGLVAGRLSRAGGRRRDLAMIAVVMVPLLNHVRNSFVQVPSQMVLALAFVGAAWLVSGRTRGEQASRGTG